MSLQTPPFFSIFNFPILSATERVPFHWSKYTVGHQYSLFLLDTLITSYDGPLLLQQLEAEPSDKEALSKYPAAFIDTFNIMRKIEPTGRRTRPLQRYNLLR